MLFKNTITLEQILIYIPHIKTDLFILIGE